MVLCFQENVEVMPVASQQHALSNATVLLLHTWKLQSVKTSDFGVLFSYLFIQKPLTSDSVPGPGYEPLSMWDT